MEAYAASPQSYGANALALPDGRFSLAGRSRLPTCMRYSRRCGPRVKHLSSGTLKDVPGQRWQPRPTSRRHAGVASATSADRGVALVEAPDEEEGDSATGGPAAGPGPSANLVAIVGAGSASPFSGASWHDVMRHMVDRLGWIEPGLQMSVFSDSEFFGVVGTGGRANSVRDTTVGTSPTLEAAVKTADILLAVDVHASEAVSAMSALAANARTFVCFDSDPALVALTCFGGTSIGNFAAGKPTLVESVKGALPWTPECQSMRTLGTVAEAWGRRKADDVLYVLLVLVDAYVAQVPMLKSLRAGGPDTLQCMIKNCGPQVLACFMDPGCRAALGCLGECAPTDQVCSYRCIVSYESPLLEAFSLCILQKHNCLGLSAEVRMRPEVKPMVSWRGAELSFDAAERIFTGWLNTPQEGKGVVVGDEYAKYEWSWRVTAGQNAAYDQFPCQYQLYYKGKARGSFWYDPVFQVRKFDGETVWRRRHYRVRRASEPGTFWLSVLDNGVISKEFWRIVDCTDDFSWALFYYSGAASNVGQAYTGAILVTPDGKWPAEDQQERILRSLDACGIKMWELYRVDNSSCAGAPLGCVA